MIAHRTLAAVAPLLLAARATLTRPAAPGLDEDTREYDVVDFDEIGPRVSRQIHGLTASELAARRAADDQAQAWQWSRIEQDLSTDADFRSLARRWTDQLPDQT